MDNIYEQVVFWVFTVSKVLVLAALVWYAFYEYRRWSEKQQAGDENDE